MFAAVHNKGWYKAFTCHMHGYIKRMRMKMRWNIRGKLLNEQAGFCLRN